MNSKCINVLMQEKFKIYNTKHLNNSLFKIEVRF